MAEKTVRNGKEYLVRDLDAEGALTAKEANLQERIAKKDKHDAVHIEEHGLDGWSWLDKTSAEEEALKALDMQADTVREYTMHSYDEKVQAKADRRIARISGKAAVVMASAAASSVPRKNVESKFHY